MPLITVSVYHLAPIARAEGRHRQRRVRADGQDPAQGSQGHRHYREVGRMRVIWFAGGKSLAEQKLASYWIDIHVTEGTNTKDEKAAYLAAMFKRMGELLGPLHPETYLHVDEVRGDAYGFGGLTQERRYIAGKLEVAPGRAASIPTVSGTSALVGAEQLLEGLPERHVDIGHRHELAEVDRAR